MSDERTPPLLLRVQRRPTADGGQLSGTVLAAQRGATPTSQSVVYFWPLYTGTSIPEDLWRDRMWLDTWV
ncbi:hypothetical protein QFZ71_002275 [Streptomyces sp. V2I9]|nr:hypothetical protein [Streptomyces sp. V2I9]